MTAPTSLRHLTREANQQQRMKARLAAWWYVERRPRDTERQHLHRVSLPLGLRAMLADNIPPPASPTASDRDDTPRH